MTQPLKSVEIAGRTVGAGAPCFIIAEAGVNHNGDLEMARRLINIAAEAGADAVKFQSFSADFLVTPHTPKADYQLRTTSGSESQHEMLKRLELSAEAHQSLSHDARRKGILFLSTPFAQTNADLLESLDVPAFKISSGDITNLAFLDYVASKKKPLIVSTGMSNLAEVAAAVNCIKSTGNDDLILLHCVSSYPAAAADVNLRAMVTMREEFGLPVGFSDHTLGTEVALAAVALGACVIEKHITLDRTLPGPDHAASLEPAELKALVHGIRIVEAALGDGRKQPADAEANTAAVARKSLVAEMDLAAGTVLTENLIAVKRPGTGLPPIMLGQLVGRTLRQDVRAGEMLSLEMLQ